MDASISTILQTIFQALEAPTVSFSSPKMRCLKSLTIRGSPSLSETAGSHPRSSFALVMSGFLLCGSSSVFGLNSIFAFGSIVSCTTYICKMISNHIISQLVSKHNPPKLGHLSLIYLSQLKHGEFTRVPEVEGAHVVAFH